VHIEALLGGAFSQPGKRGSTSSYVMKPSSRGEGGGGVGAGWTIKVLLYPEFEPLKELIKTLHGLTKKEREKRIREWHKLRQEEE